MQELVSLVSNKKTAVFVLFLIAAYQFWYEHGWIVGEVLRPEQGLTFAEIVWASEEYLLDHPEPNILMPLHE